jgi:hypothetical protein
MEMVLEEFTQPPNKTLRVNTFNSPNLCKQKFQHLSVLVEIELWFKGFLWWEILS